MIRISCWGQNNPQLCMELKTEYSPEGVISTHQVAPAIIKNSSQRIQEEDLILSMQPIFRASVNLNYFDYGICFLTYHSR